MKCFDVTNSLFFLAKKLEQVFRNFINNLIKNFIDSIRMINHAFNRICCTYKHVRIIYFCINNLPSREPPYAKINFCKISLAKRLELM